MNGVRSKTVNLDIEQHVVSRDDDVLWCAFAADGDSVFHSTTKAVKLRDLKTGKIRRIFLGHKKSIRDADVSRDGTMLATASFDRTVKLWDVKSGREIISLAVHAPVSCCAFSPDAKKVAVVSKERLTVWCAETGQRILCMRGTENLDTYKDALISPSHGDTIYDCAYSPDGRKIVTASGDNTLKIWEADTGQELLKLKGHTGNVTCCDFSPDGHNVLSGSLDKTLKLSNAESAEEIFSLAGHKKAVQTCAFSPGGEIFVSSGSDNTMKIWRAKTGELILAVALPAEDTWCCAFSPDGKGIVASGSDGVWTWDMGEL